MRKKPSGQKYRNLYARAGSCSIYYQRHVGDVRVRFSAKTDDWDQAAAVRDLYEQRRGVGTAMFPAATVPSFGEAADRYLHESTGHLASTTQSDRTLLLGPKGLLTRYWGTTRIDQITKGALLEWWAAEVTGRGRAHKTGMNYLDAIAGVLGYAVDLSELVESPVDAVRATLRRRRRTQRGRAEGSGGVHVNPIAPATGLRRFVEVSRELGQTRRGNGKALVGHRDGHVADMLMLDAGLRLGEVTGLCWGDVAWGSGPNDPARCLVVQRSVSRGEAEGPTKSGRARRVQLSRRLRSVLREHWVEQGQPRSSERVLPRFNGRNYRARHFDEVLRRAGLAGHTPKDLRDTFASWLVSLGVPVPWVSESLGHSNWAVTARHYARWIDDAASRELVPQLEPGDVWPDLLAQLAATIAPESPPNRPHADFGQTVTSR
jgi:integrase